MAKIPIWPGSSSFNSLIEPTPFGFYDDDDDFRNDADKIAKYVVQRLGFPLVDIELQDINLYSCFEEAVTEYGGQVYQFQIINNLIDLKGLSTGSTFNNILVGDEYGVSYTNPSSDGYTGGDGGGASDYGGDSNKVQTGSLDVKRGIQRYDLIDNLGSTISGSNPSNITIKRIYHYAPPAINRYFDPYAGTGTGIQSLMQTFGFGNYSPGVNFMLMPMYFDVLKLQAIELNDTIRKSDYHFEINQNRYLKLFPIPTSDYTLHFEYTQMFTSDDGQQAGDIDPQTGEERALSQITDMSNVPYRNPIYKFINDPGRQWIRKYTLALAKEMLGSVRGKYQALPIPGETTTLDYSRLLDEAKSEKEALITQLREDLDATTTLSQLERQSNENLNQVEGLGREGKYQIYIH